MSFEKFTGVPPPIYVKEQIDFRQKILGSRLGGETGQKYLEVINNRGVFARIASAIYIDNLDDIKQQVENLESDGKLRQAKAAREKLNQFAAQRLKNSGFSQNFIDRNAGRELARNFVIQGTVLKKPFTPTFDSQGNYGVFGRGR